MRKSQTGWQVPWKAARSGMLSALAETNTMSVESVSHPAYRRERWWLEE